ncbi:hypothetical protein CHH55_02455 [Niallia circulans]|uniref:hypothetical protein n=1 Tax=Niallia circulans TaxID=1397 RepID=UPI000BA6CEF0|nr:hypothetical protein [Niallia circulans]PAD89525.1 hypothetical protein CHH55_02455 [Niallia circulans]
MWQEKRDGFFGIPPKAAGNGMNCCYISQSGEEISQPAEISAKVEGKSANLQKYQPKWRGNQPTCRNISQSGEEISQPAGYQPKRRGNQPTCRIYQPNQIKPQQKAE